MRCLIESFPVVIFPAFYFSAFALDTATCFLAFIIFPDFLDFSLFPVACLGAKLVFLSFGCGHFFLCPCAFPFALITGVTNFWTSLDSRNDRLLSLYFIYFFNKAFYKLVTVLAICIF